MPRYRAVAKTASPLPYGNIPVRGGGMTPETCSAAYACPGPEIPVHPTVRAPSLIRADSRDGNSLPSRGKGCDEVWWTRVVTRASTRQNRTDERAQRTSSQVRENERTRQGGTPATVDPRGASAGPWRRDASLALPVALSWGQFSGGDICTLPIARGQIRPGIGCRPSRSDGPSPLLMRH